MSKLSGGQASVRVERRLINSGIIAARRWLQRAAVLVCDTAGTSAVEFAVAAPVLLALLVPLVDLGMAYSQKIQVQQAAQAGAEYAALHPWNSGSATAIAGAVTSANSLPGLSATPSPYQSCGCPNGSAIALATCGSTCGNGETAGYYVVVNAQANYSTVLPYSVLPSPVTLGGQSTVRIQ
jgi:Flp pilus assembly protein TadG